MSTLKYTLKRREDKLILSIPDLEFETCVDFSCGRLYYQIQNIKNQPKPLLVKAICGNKSPASLKVIDATAGLGSDSFILAAYGIQVLMIEQEQFVYKLLVDGIRRANKTHQIKDIMNNFKELIQGDAKILIPTVTTNFLADVIYLDVMFEHNSKAKAKKPMYMLQKITKSSSLEENLQLLEISKKHSNKVVIKRHKKNDFLANSKPSYSLHGKTCRFDVYI